MELECWRMQLWFAHKSAVTLREQLVTQIILAILSDDLGPGQRLPSTRELARRFRLHPNTVSAGYRQLERERWVEVRRGSGVYVRDTKPESAISPAFAFDQLIAELLHSARKLGIPLATVRLRLRHLIELQPPDRFLLIEPDEELRRILAAEIQGAVTLPVKSCGLHDSQLLQEAEGAIAVALAGKEKMVRPELPEGTELLMLQVRSVPASLAGWLPAPSGILIGVASRWPRLPEIGSHHAGCRGVSFRWLAISRRSPVELAARFERDCGGRLRPAHRIRTVQDISRCAISPDFGRFLGRSAALRGVYP